MSDLLVNGLEPIATPIGKSFDGTIYQTDQAGLEQVALWAENNAMTESGIRSLGKIYGLPHKLMHQLPREVLKNVLVAQRQHATRDASTFNILEVDGEIAYVAPHNDAGIDDPMDTVFKGMDPLNITTDYNRGVSRYFISESKEKDTAFYPGLYINIPILWWGNVDVEGGMFRLICRNGLVDQVNTVKGTFKPVDQGLGTLAQIISALASSFTSTGSGYMQYLSYLQEKEFSLKQARGVYEDWIEEGLISKSFVKRCLTHLDIIEDGGELEFGPECPATVKSMDDLVNISTFFAQEQSFGSRNKIEAHVFKHSHRLWKEESGQSIIKFDAKKGTEFAEVAAIGDVEL